VASPHQHGFARNLVGKIDEPQLLAYGQSLRYYCKAAFRPNIDRVIFRA